MKSKSCPLHWLTLVFLTLGFLCNSLALVLPYWYAKFPQSRNHFLNLGLWEVCFSDFMPEGLGNLMYTGCFYIYDGKIRDLWPIIFRVWFIVCQVFHTLSFVTYVVSEAVMLTQAFQVISLRGPRAVLFVIITCSLTCIFVLIDLITMGVGVDNESKRLPLNNQKWLISLDQCTLSWSYGLSAFSFLGSFLTLIILSWFVYPKRSSDRLLTVNAWNWPNRSEILCQPQVNDLRFSRENSRVNSSNRSRSIMSTSGDQVQSVTRPLLSVRQPSAHPITISSQTAARMTSHERQNLPTVTRLKNVSLESSVLSGDQQKRADPAEKDDELLSIDYGQSPPVLMSSYDPRSADTVSLLSSDQPSVNRRPEGHSVEGTVSEQSSLRTLGSGSGRMSHPGAARGCPSQEDVRRYQYQPNAQRRRHDRVRGQRSGSVDGESGDTLTDTHLSATTLTIQGPPVQPIQLQDGLGGRHLASASSGFPDTSMWSVDSAIQTARPMKKQHSGSRSQDRLTRQTTNEEEARKREAEALTNHVHEQEPAVLVQTARPMRRKH